MTSLEHLDVLRKRNKDLLSRLKQRGEELMRLHGCSPSERMETEDGEEERRDPAEMMTVSDGQDGQCAREDLAKPVARSAGSCEEQSRVQHIIPTSLSTEPSKCSADATAPSDGSRHHSELQDNRPTATQPQQVTHSEEQKEAESQVSSRLDEPDGISDRHYSHPLLGYDWIAGVLDVEDSLIERSDEYFNDLQTFRLLNKDKCVYGPSAEFSNNECDPSPLVDNDKLEADMDTHQCTFPYLMNDRFFLVPRHSEECCPGCKIPKTCHPHTESDPALVRVSIPCSVILPASKHKAHRRCSFDPADGLGLPSHCLLGWSNKCQSPVQPPSGLDLKSNTKKNSTGTQTNEVEILPAPKVSWNDVSELSRLPPFNFQHLSPKRKRPCTFFMDSSD